jgi:hypothetical protein
MIALTFAEDVKAREVYEYLRKLVAAAKPLPDDYINIHKCYHDEGEGRPCELIREWKPAP